MKKIFAILTISMFAIVSVNATYAADKENDKQKTPHVKGFISNRFADNWELQLGVGPTFQLNTGSGEKSVHVAGFIAATKWFHPVFGARMTGELGKYRHINSDPNACTTHDPNCPNAHKDDNKWSFIYAHPDFMIDMTNWIGGYKEDRLWNSILYIGAGIMAGGLDDYAKANGKPTVQFAGNVGWQNRFRVHKAFSIDLTLEYILADSSIRPVATNLKSDRFHGLNAFVGFTYKFNKRTYERSGATEAEAKAMLASVKKSQDEAAAAKDKSDKLQALADQQAKALKSAEDAAKAANARIKELEKAAAPRPQAANAKEAVDSDNFTEILFFDYGVGTLNSYNKKRLDLVAAHIKASKKATFIVDGFADPETGAKKNNERLAGKRAKAAYDYLVSKGIDASRLELRNSKTTNCPFGKPAHNRVVVVY